jgi:glycosyltransferase involved in cell wall biosynthesis
MVQVESMLCGTPVVASDLPGVRQPTTLTGMGGVVPPADGKALAEGILEVLRDPQKYSRRKEDIEKHFSQEVIAEQYEQIYSNEVARKRGLSTG